MPSEMEGANVRCRQGYKRLAAIGLGIAPGGGDWPVLSGRGIAADTRATSMQIMNHAVDDTPPSQPCLGRPPAPRRLRALVLRRRFSCSVLGW